MFHCFPAAMPETLEAPRTIRRAIGPEHVEMRMSSDENRTTVKFTTDGIKRDGAVLDPDGLDVTNFLRNPVVMWDHGWDPRRGSQPIAKAVDVRRKGDGWMATVEWYDDEFSQSIKRQVKEGYINAVSVGWQGRAEQREVDGQMVPYYASADMTEFSFVSVPADPDALVMQRKADELAALRQEVSGLKESISELQAALQESRAAATAAPAPDESASEATADEAASEVPDDVPDEPSQPRAATQADYERLAARLVPLVNQVVKRQLGRA